MTKPNVAIIGSGISGLICASELNARGFRVTVLDKARGPGGRMSTRRVPELGDDADFDHGAQYFTVRTRDLAERVAVWQSEGLVAPWRGSFVGIDDAGITASSGDTRRFVGTPGMSSICRALAQSLDVRFEIPIGRVTQTDDRWTLESPEGDAIGQCDLLLCTAPAPQTAALLRDVAPAIARQAEGVAMQPCWAVLVAFDQPLGVGFDGAFINSGPLSWAARTSSKPGRQPVPERWVLHASTDWSTAHLEQSASEVLEPLLAGFFAAIGVRAQTPAWARAHRWRYALAEGALDEGYLLDVGARVGACGDWTNGNRVEGAFSSGLQAAQGVIAQWGR